MAVALLRLLSLGVVAGAGPAPSSDGWPDRQGGGPGLSMLVSCSDWLGCTHTNTQTQQVTN